ncbi:MAG: DNA-directed RNA polymerase subunit beta [Christensenellaceae bacterium]|jgi:DNA-directed RNA polymerase subunit beta|nr:DNA-directed RNA polymerase subunit beta [Christensenellaceae bacterium]
MQKETGLVKEICGKNTRMVYRRVPEILEVPYLLDVQKQSFKKFITKGIAEILDEFNPITDYSGKIELYFLDHYIADESKYEEAECLRRGQMYVKPLKVRVRVVFKETGEIIEQEVFLGDIPMMTESGYFIINGVARVIVNQIIKSPNAYFDMELDKKTGKETITATLSPTHGAYIELLRDDKGFITASLNRTNKIGLGTMLKAFDFGSDAEIISLFEEHPLIKQTLEKDTSKGAAEKGKAEALIEVSRRMRPSELPNAEAMEQGLNTMFFTFPNYDLANVGRYKFNKKFCISRRIVKGIAGEDIRVNGETIVKKGDEITREEAEKIQNAGINIVHLENEAGELVQVIGNNSVDVNKFLGTTSDDTGITELVYLPTLREVLEGAKDKKARIVAVRANAKRLVNRALNKDDILAAVSYLLNLNDGIGVVDNIDHLGNRRLNTVCDLMMRHFKDGMLKLRNGMRETMQTMELSSKEVNPVSIINAKAISRALKDFCSISQLSHVMDTNNPLTEITQKRKITSVGPGGITKERATSEVRDLHYTHNGRLCAIETPEGQSIGLVNSLAMFAKINEYGFITAPLRRVDSETGKVTEIIDYLTADEEDSFFVAQAVEPLNADGTFKNEYVLCRHRDTVQEVARERVDYMDASPRQFISVATALIPFLENDDTGRALLGSNMQRQAVPLIKTEAPLVATGLEHRTALDSNVLVVAKRDGVVYSVQGDRIIIEAANGEKDFYQLTKFTRFNEEACINQKPIVKKGEKVKAGDIIADGYATSGGELSIGKNMCVAYMNWEGYNFEDAILISERVVKQDKFTSIALHLKECKARTTKLGEEEITRDIPNLSEDALKNLDERGIVRVGSFVRPGDILVGKVTPKGETELTPEERLLRAIFGEKSREVKDSSMRVENGKDGVVVAVECFSRKNKDEMEVGVNEVIKVTIAQKRNIKVGDKMTGRHGNKGIVSKVLPVEDMPYMADGTPVDIVLNPLGVPSRLNIGQLLEVSLGLVAKQLGWHVATPVFNGCTENDIQKLLVENGLPADGKMQLFDGRTGEPFENPTTVGYMYMLKLHHMVDTKIHARSTGAYSLVTQQPLGGKAQFGGQRMGEMEVWALEAYGAAHLLQEMLTVKSDDVMGRTKTFISIVNGQPLPEPGIPEATKVMIRELQGLGLDMAMINKKNEEVEIGKISDAPIFVNPTDINEPKTSGEEINIDDILSEMGATEDAPQVDTVEEFDLGSDDKADTNEVDLDSLFE